MEKLDKMAFQCLKRLQIFYLIDGKLIHVKQGEDFEFAGMTVCRACAKS